MEEELVPYELALKLRELGFNKECFGWWGSGGILNQNYDLSNTFKAPLWQQAFKWFQDKGYFCQIYPDNQQFVNDAKEWFYVISKGTRQVNEKRFTTFEDAMYGCLNELIKIENEGA